jgi:hypothetical protein
MHVTIGPHIAENKLHTTNNCIWQMWTIYMVCFYNYTYLLFYKGLPIIATLALGSRPKQRGYKGVGQEKAREWHHILPGV